MSIVSNIMPISELYKVGQLDLLKIVYGCIVIPDDVLQELEQAKTLPELGEAVVKADCIVVRSVAYPQNIQSLINRYAHIGRGEAAAIVLAQELAAKRIIIDDKKARQVARAERLPLIGTVGVVLLAYRLRRITAQQAQDSLDRLYAGTAYISAELYRSAKSQL